MKRVLIAAMVLLLPALAMSQVSFGGGAQVGVSIGSFPKPLNEYYGFGFGGGVHGDVNLMKFLTLRLNVDYHTFSSDKSKITDVYVKANPGTAAGDFDISGLNASVIGISMNGVGKIPTGGPVTPYGVLGVGLHITGVSDVSVKYKGQEVQTGKIDGETNFGMNFGAGAEFKVGSVKLSAEIKYVLIFTKTNNTSHIPIMFGVTI